jgi:hypothetical protein
VDAGRQINPVADRDEEGLGLVARTHNRANDFAIGG